MMKFINETNATLQSHSLVIRNQIASSKNLEIQVRQLANLLFEKVQGTFSSNIMTKLKKSAKLFI